MKAQWTARKATEMKKLSRKMQDKDFFFYDRKLD